MDFTSKNLIPLVLKTKNIANFAEHRKAVILY